MLKKGGSNWVEGVRFFDREIELEVLEERVKDGTHTLLTAQRHMGKTSLVRELLRRLAKDGAYGFVSGLLEDWWQSRYGQYFVSVLEQDADARRNRR
ncbi:hypothetical protein [Candidatus Rariloculus sp.]|uniref:hypothetical protein n=1 Tax=Candidatus Rariloculus sp. TaxID=3101265 RepID=UPI003D0CF977